MEKEKFDKMLVRYDGLKKLAKPDWVRIDNDGDELTLIFEFNI